MTSGRLPKPESTFAAYRLSDRLRSTPRDIALTVAACVVLPLLIAYGFGRNLEIEVVAVIVGIVGLVLGLAYPFWALIFFVALLR